MMPLVAVVYASQERQNRFIDVSRRLFRGPVANIRQLFSNE